MSDTPTEAIVTGILIIGSIGVAIGSYVFSAFSSSKTAQRTASASRTMSNSTIYGTYYCLDAILNGLRITDTTYSSSISNNDIIRKFYIRKNVLWACKHGFVVFQTGLGKNYMCHLTADKQKRLRISVEESDWKVSENMVVSVCSIPIKNFKNYIEDYRNRFGHYVLGLNDCRHVADKVADFLKKTDKAAH